MLSERIAKRIRVLGLNNSQLAREVGVSPQAIRKIVTGETTNTVHIYKIAKALQTTPEYLIGEVDDPLPVAPVEPQLVTSSATAIETYTPDLVNIHEIDLTMGMGLSYLDVPVTQRVRTFDRNWLRQYTHAKPDLLFFCEGIGNSMEPYIHSHDLLLIDTSEKCVRMSDQIWAVTYGNCGSVKRLRPMADGSIKMMAENPAVSDEFAYDGELSLIGRVVAIVRKI